MWGKPVLPAYYENTSFLHFLYRFAWMCYKELAMNIFCNLKSLLLGQMLVAGRMLVACPHNYLRNRMIIDLFITQRFYRVG